MSLILEALKKLEREKKTEERGFLVTTRAVWPSAGARPLPYILAGAALLAVGAFGTWLVLDGSWLVLDGSRRPRPAAAPAAPPPTTQRAAVPAANPTALPPILLPAPAPRPSPEPRRPVATRSAPREVPSPEPSGPAELRLEAVSRRDGLPIAVVSGHLVHEGDSFDNVRVIRIGDTDVEIEVDGQRRVLSF